MKSKNIEALANRLAIAVKEWAKVDSNVADVGWTKANEWKWDDCRDAMTGLADKVLAMTEDSAGQGKKHSRKMSAK